MIAASSLRRSLMVFSALAGLAISATAPATAKPLETLPHGNYHCATKGDASGAVWRFIDGQVIRIRNASTYRLGDGSGTYLMVGKVVTFTRGPLKGQKFKRTGNRTLRTLNADGSEGAVRCLRGGWRANEPAPLPEQDDYSPFTKSG